MSSVDYPESVCVRERGEKDGEERSVWKGKGMTEREGHDHKRGRGEGKGIE